jgi:hypothetical protein
MRRGRRHGRKLARRYGHAKGHVPLHVLEKRARRLVALVKKRGGKA